MSHFQGTYNDEVIRRLLVLKKLDGYPVIREVMEEEKEEEMTTLDMKEIQNMAEKLDADEVTFLQRDQICYFGKSLKVYRQLLKALFTIWQNFEPTLANILCNWANYIHINGQILKSSLAIWSHCLPIKSILTYFTLNRSVSIQIHCD